jgi:hypothetical protein
MFVDHFIREPWQKKSPALAILRASQILHERTNGKFDKLYQKCANFLNPSKTLPAPTLLDWNTIKTTVSNLNKDGCYVLPVKLTPEDLQEIRDFAFSNPAYAKNVNERIYIRPDAVPTDHGRYMWLMESLTRLKAVQRLMNDSTLHQIAQEYVGGACVLTSITLWLDPAYKGEFDPHVYHYDNDGPKFLKYFFYITDVEPDTGAHKFIRGTHNHTKPEQFRISKRYDEKILLDYWGKENEIVFAAPAGTILAEDTAGFHRGSTVKRDYRLLMQFQYALLDIPHTEELENKIAPFPLPGLNKNISKIVKKFYKAA